MTKKRDPVKETLIPSNGSIYWGYRLELFRLHQRIDELKTEKEEEYNKGYSQAALDYESRLLDMERELKQLRRHDYFTPWFHYYYNPNIYTTSGTNASCQYFT